MTHLCLYVDAWAQYPRSHYGLTAVQLTQSNVFFRMTALRPGVVGTN